MDEMSDESKSKKSGMNNTLNNKYILFFFTQIILLSSHLGALVSMSFFLLIYKLEEMELHKTSAFD